MKVSVILLSIICLSTFNIQSQVFRGGFKGGVVASEVSGDHLSGPNKFGLYGSAFTMLPLSQYSFLQMEVMYIQKGSRSVPSESNNYFDYRFNLQYVEVPFLFVQNMSAYTSLNYLDKILFHGGLSVSFLVNSNESEDLVEYPNRSDFNAAELNLLVGFSYPLYEALYLNFGYSNSLTPIRSHADGQTTWINRGQYNVLWTLGLTWIFW
ncbi:porin family protein [Alkalitalea saponilacus]|uniref:Outer membrane protein beta-barrel domain-containing protein n=1 Tax=Alkalitalea saponilacus TaxID=889453 RepID=A0A1T5HTP4_9BACT|nr:porin family protein [Alkalitalea saponilacus]ASB49293.1 hypothetical protein CDL62_09140 [Alkalitalea saponilacus]SKC24043.1 Outer membrane protein beta-barrel domain-containing protein [Alkalitalea saponilacus]